jgi:hypothetical protein
VGVLVLVLVTAIVPVLVAVVVGKLVVPSEEEGIGGEVDASGFSETKPSSQYKASRLVFNS